MMIRQRVGAGLALPEEGAASGTPTFDAPRECFHMRGYDFPGAHGSGRRPCRPTTGTEAGRYREED